jgi:phosphoserine phosphatase RsbU/P
MEKLIDSLPVSILLVEDSPFDAELLQRVLRGTSFRLQRCDHLEAALTILGDTPIDLVLLDLVLPDSHGLETVRRAHNHAPHVPIIVLTGSQDEELGLRAIQSGAQDYLVKGEVEARVLVRAMRYAIERKRAQEEIAKVARELRERNDQLERDLELAREIQLSFLPAPGGPIAPTGSLRAVGSSFAFAHRYYSSGPVGGDFFDITSLSPSTAAVLICDVMGHGVRAALVTAMLRTVIQEAQPWAADPAQMLTRLNCGLRSVLRNSDNLIFATGCYLVADAALGTVRLANAGHPSPLLIRRAGGRAFALGGEDAPGPALGLLERPSYTTSEHRLDGGDRLMLFTDGLFDACTGLSGPHGSERLLELASARAASPAEELLQALLGDRPATPARPSFPDDVCVVVVDVSPSCAQIARAA